MGDHILNSTIIGLGAGEIVWSSDFTASRSSKGEWTGSESFFVNILETTNFLPVNGASCQFPGFDFLKVQGCKVDNYEGDICQVNVIYGGNDDIDDGGGGGNDEDPGNGLYSVELVIQTSEEPIATNYKYIKDDSGITAEEKLIIKNYMSGKFVPKGEQEADKYKFIDINNHLNGKPLEVTSVKGRELIDFLTNNVEGYLKPKQIWRATYISDKMVPATWLNRVGFISVPLGNPPTVSDNRDWLFNGISISSTGKGDGTIYTITLEWILSGIGGWHQKIYNKTLATA